MGRSPGVIDEDLSQRSWRRRATATKENIECSGHAANDGKRVLYCKNCEKDILGKIHFKCAQCLKLDLCVECFSVGAEVTPDKSDRAEVTPHKSDHPYRVMDNYSFSLICPNWNAGEEILLLQGIEKYGLEDRISLPLHVGSKSYDQCFYHYMTSYLDSPNSPMDKSHVAGNNREDPLSMAKEHQNDSGTCNGSTPATISSADKTISGADKMVSNLAPILDDPNSVDVEDAQHRDVSKSISSWDEVSSLVGMSGYNLKRQDFCPEYDTDAEQLIADIKFKETDTKTDRELKLRMLHIYNQRLDERERRKEFILERNLVFPDPLLRDCPLEEKEIHQQYNVFMRFHSKEEHEEMIRTVIEEHRIRKRIHELQEAQNAGCRTSMEADIYFEQKRKKIEETPCQAKQNSPAFRSTEISAGQASASSSDNWDITGIPRSDLLSESEKRLCCEARMLPSQYLKMQEIMSMHIFSGNIRKKSDAYGFFTTDQSIVDRVYDMLVRKGIIPA